MRIAIREACRCSRRDQRRLRLCLQGRTRREAAKDLERVVAGFPNQFSRTERRPEVVVDGKREALRHHADDRCPDVAQPHCAADHRPVTAKTRLPQAMSQNDRGRTQILIRTSVRPSSGGTRVIRKAAGLIWRPSRAQRLSFGGEVSLHQPAPTILSVVSSSRHVRKS